jgi:gluconokinase
MRQDRAADGNLPARLVSRRQRREGGLPAPHRAPIAVVMGVSGSGKSTIGRALAHRLGWRFQEGDALHPPENVAKMRAGLPLDDKDRGPWLRAIAARIDQWREEGEAGVITCSALKRKYRGMIVGDRPEVRLVYLTAPPALIAARLAARHGHFMPASLLASQLAALEPPGSDENALTVAVDAPVETVVERIAASLIADDMSHGGTIE